MNYTLLCDFYELTMGNGYFQTGGYADQICYFDVFFRNVPDGGGFAIAAGSIIYTGIRMQLGGQGGRGATTAADAVAELPMKVLGTLFIAGAGAGILGMFL